MERINRAVTQRNDTIQFYSNEGANTFAVGVPLMVLSGHT